MVKKSAKYSVLLQQLSGQTPVFSKECFQGTCSTLSLFGCFCWVWKSYRQQFWCSSKAYQDNREFADEGFSNGRKCGRSWNFNIAWRKFLGQKWSILKLFQRESERLSVGFTLLRR